MNKKSALIAVAQLPRKLDLEMENRSTNAMFALVNF
jgi:hypothetical protein